MKPKTLFLIDGMGALLSAFLLGIILVRLEYLFGIPTSILYPLAILPCFFAIFDFYCYRYVKENLANHLMVIAFLNIMYCALSIGLGIIHPQITSLGWTYIILEVVIIVSLAYIEYKTAIQHA